MHESIPTKTCPPRVLHSLSARIPGFVPSELPWSRACYLISYGYFPLGRIFRAERHFFLFKDQLAESERQQTKENIPPSGKRPLSTKLPADATLRHFTASNRSFDEGRTLKGDQPLRLLLNLFFYQFNRFEHTFKSQRIKLPDVIAACNQLNMNTLS